MTEIHSGAHGAPDAFDPSFSSSEFPHESPHSAAEPPSDARAFDEPASDEHSPSRGSRPAEDGDAFADADPPDEDAASTGDATADADAAGPKRRRRGSRGGRRRRGRRDEANSDEPAADTATAAAVEPPVPGEDDPYDPADEDLDGESGPSKADGGPSGTGSRRTAPKGAAPKSAAPKSAGSSSAGSSSAESGSAESGSAESGSAESGSAESGAPRRRSRRGRGGRGRADRPADRPAADEAAPAERTPAERTPASPARSASGTASAGARTTSDAGSAPRRRGSSRAGDRPAGGAAPGRPRAPARPAARAPRGSVPRELDSFDDDADLALDAVPAVEVDGVAEERNTQGDGFVGADDKKRSRRGSRGGRRRKKSGTTESTPRAPSPSPVEIETIPGEDDDLPVYERTPALETEPGAIERGGSARGSRRRRRGRGRTREDAEADPEVDPDAPRVVPESERRSMILVNATDPEEQRVAVLEDGKITDFLMTVKDQDTLVNDIYRGRVVNLEPAIGAAFIDFGQGRNGFLHTSDVLSAYGDKDFDLDKLLSTQIDPEEWDANSGQPAVAVELDDDEDEDEDSSRSGRSSGKGKGGKEKDAKGGRGKRRFEARPRLPITDLLKKGQTVVVQVTKDAIGDKGPTLTTYISIPGRYLVLMPSMSRTGVSRKIEDEKERRRLKRILQSLEVPKGMGVIVRTAGVGHSKNEIKRDLDYLVSLWTAFGKKLHQGHGPAPLYRESDVAIKTMRDLFSTNTKAVIVDDPEIQRQIVDFTEKLMPEDVGRVQLHDGPKTLFQAYNVEPDFERIFQRRIELPSGGSIVFDQAEALVAIDVNSGRTRSDGFDFEDIALKTNLEAAPEIARQMRLRDLGGIIVVDFIDMMKMSNIRAVEKEFKEALEDDRARSKIGRISQFGLLEMTRQRLGPGMDKKVFHHCPRCRGTGRIRTVNSRAAAILRRLSSALTHKGFQTVEVRAHPEVVAYLKSDCSDHMRALEYRLQKDVRLIEVADQAEDSVLRYLRVDGREVRPGGRRKR